MLSRSWHFISLVVCLRNSEMSAVSLLPQWHSDTHTHTPLLWHSLPVRVDRCCTQLGWHESRFKNQTTTTWPATAVCLSVRLSVCLARPLPCSLLAELPAFFCRVAAFVSLFNGSMKIICELFCHISFRFLSSVCTLWLSISEGCQQRIEYL